MCTQKNKIKSMYLLHSMMFETTHIKNNYKSEKDMQNDLDE